MINKTADIIKKYFDKGRPDKSVTEFHNTITRIDNSFISSNSVLLEETLTGDIYSLKEVIIAENASVSGSITSRNCTVKGKVFGNIVSTNYVDIKSTAEVNGNIRTEIIQIAPGSVINGHIHIEEGINESDLVNMVEKALPYPVKEQPTIAYPKAPEQQVYSSQVKEKPKMKSKQPAPIEQKENVSDSWY